MNPEDTNSKAPKATVAPDAQQKKDDKSWVLAIVQAMLANN